MRHQQPNFRRSDDQAELERAHKTVTEAILWGAISAAEGRAIRALDDPKQAAQLRALRDPEISSRLRRSQEILDKAQRTYFEMPPTPGSSRSPSKAVPVLDAEGRRQIEAMQFKARASHLLKVEQSTAAAELAPQRILCIYLGADKHVPKAFANNPDEYGITAAVDAGFPRPQVVEALKRLKEEAPELFTRSEEAPR